MKYFKIPIYNNILDIDKEKSNFQSIFYTGDGITAYGVFLDGEIKNSWLEITEEEFNYLMLPPEQEEINFEYEVLKILNTILEKLYILEQQQNYLLFLNEKNSEEIILEEDKVYD